MSDPDARAETGSNTVMNDVALGSDVTVDPGEAVGTAAIVGDTLAFTVAARFGVGLGEAVTNASSERRIVLSGVGVDSGSGTAIGASAGLDAALGIGVCVGVGTGVSGTSALQAKRAMTNPAKAARQAMMVNGLTVEMASTSVRDLGAVSE